MNSMLTAGEKNLRKFGAGRLTALAGIACLATACFTNPGLAQNQPSADPPPLDINDVNADRKPAVPPVVVTPTTPDAKPADGAASPQAAEKPAPQPPISQNVVEADGPSYPVGRFLMQWQSQNDQHPPADDLLKVKVTLGVTPDGYVSSYALDEKANNGSPQLDQFGRVIPRGIPTVTITLGDVAEGGQIKFYASALRDINQAIIEEMNRRGFIAVFSHPAEDMIDPETGDDLRDNKTSDLRLVVWTGWIEEVRTVSSGDRLAKKIEQGKLTRVNTDDSVSNRIREQSPVREGDLVNRAMIDNYVFRLNRHPGRRVDVAVSPGTEPEAVTLDYLVTESKPWTAYFQLSNTGTEQTSILRERFGYLNNQFTGHDDIFSLDYITGNFDASNTVALNYQIPIISDKFFWRNYASWSEYQASEIGFANEEFSGVDLTIGSELRYNLFQHKELFIDGVGGLRWQDIRTDNELSGEIGQDNFFEPYFGAVLERYTDDMSTYMSLMYYTNADELNPQEADLLGRPDVDLSFFVIRFQAEQSAFIEPLLNRWGWFQGNDGKGFTTLANELAVSTRGQWAPDSNRLIPNEEDVAGGMFSVRGYPESIAAGDNVIMGTVEYRFHVPNYLNVSDPGKMGTREMPSFMGKDFRWTPQQAFGRADWDLILKGFFDWASVNVNKQQPGEFPSTLLSVGLGFEVLVKRNLSFRLDWGVALKAAGEVDPVSGEAQVQPGNNEFNFLFTASY